MANVLDLEIVVIEFKLHSLLDKYLCKWNNIFYTPTMGEIMLSSYKGFFGLK